MATPFKNRNPSRSHFPENYFPSENSDPNKPISTPSKKPFKSPPIKPASVKKTAPETLKRVISPPQPPRGRTFIVAKKNSRRQGKDLDLDRCRKAAYEALRASQEDFFRKDQAGGSKDEVKRDPEIDREGLIGSPEAEGGLMGDFQDLEGSSKVRKMRSIVMEEAMSSIPEPGSGLVKHLVKAFETLLSISPEGEVERDEDNKKRVMNWALPGLRQPAKAIEEEVSSCFVSTSAEFFPSHEFGKDSRVNNNGDRLSLGSRTSSGSRRSRRNSTDSCERSWNKKLKVTGPQPFKLRTEQRGRLKEEHFLMKVKEMLIEEEKKRIPVAQGLPWTTDEPEILVKPPVKESTEPIDLVLHSDVRAVERAEFDNYVAERMTLAEQMRMERERQQKLEEEEEIRRLRRELVPRAQPMPYFDRPFVPKRSARPRTIPKEPRFHIRPMKPSCISMLER